MKKHILLATTLLISSLASFAQSTLLVTNLTTGSSVITNSMVIYPSVVGGALDIIDINIKNTSSSTKAYKMRRYDDLLNPGAVAYFCFNALCYPASTTTSPSNCTLTANQDASSIGKTINIHYDEAPSPGMSDIRYEIYDANNPTDFFTFTIKYNNPLAVKNYASLVSLVSDVYPNPSNTKANINVSALSDINNVTVSITNTLGSIVSSKSVELFLGKNSIALDVDSLPSGIYFTTITSGNFKSIKKFTINK